MAATFLPDVGLLGASLRWDGQEFLDLHGGIDAARAGHTTGLPLLHPWANRLGARHYAVEGVDVDLDGLDLHTDGNGLPIHGTMLARPGWQLGPMDEGRAGATVQAELAFDEHPDLLRSFPFPHRLMVEITVDGALTVTTTLQATGDEAVPVSFGWHPYFHLPRSRRHAIELQLPDRQEVVLDGRGLPTGESTIERGSSNRLEDRSYDDLFVLAGDRRMAITGGGHRLSVRFDHGYPFAQVYAPSTAPFVCLEPMTAMTNALVAGSCPLVAPGDAFTASFTVAIEKT
jgi:galactose mutarotase-like enzyme